MTLTTSQSLWRFSCVALACISLAACSGDAENGGESSESVLGDVDQPQGTISDDLPNYDLLPNQDSIASDGGSQSSAGASETPDTAEKPAEDNGGEASDSEGDANSDTAETAPE